MEFTKEELEKLVENVAENVAEKVAMKVALCVGECPYDKECPCDTEEHRLHHQWTKEMIKVLYRWNQVKWSVIKAVAVVLAVSFIGFIGIKGIKGP